MFRVGATARVSSVLIRPQVRLTGLTGRLEFDREGFRTAFDLDIVEISKDGLIKVRLENAKTKGCFLLKKSV